MRWLALGGCIELVRLMEGKMLGLLAGVVSAVLVVGVGMVWCGLWLFFAFWQLFFLLY